MPGQTIASHTAARVEQRAEGTPAGTDGPALATLRLYWPQLRHLLPSHVKPEAWYAAVYAALYRGTNRSKRDQLDLITCADANPESLMFALFDAARQGLDPGTEQYYLTPRPNKNAKGGREVLGIRGYQGEIELIYRAGAVSSVIVECVRRDDDYRYQRGVDQFPIHRFDPWVRKEARGELVGVYAYCVMKDGACSRVVELNLDDIERAKRSSPTVNSDYSPWKTDEESMFLKTGVHRIQKFVPTSAEHLTVRATVAATSSDSPRSVLDGSGGTRALSPLTQAVVASLPAGSVTPDPPLNPAMFAQPPAPEDVREETESPTDQPAPAPEKPASQPQHRAIMRLIGGLISADPHRHAVYTDILGRAVTSGKDLTVSDASRVIEVLNGWQRTGVLESSIAALKFSGTGPRGDIVFKLDEGGINTETGAALLTALTDRDITTTGELTDTEADVVIAWLAQWSKSTTPLIEAVIELIDRPEGS